MMRPHKREGASPWSVRPFNPELPSIRTPPFYSIGPSSAIMSRDAAPPPIIATHWWRGDESVAPASPAGGMS